MKKLFTLLTTLLTLSVAASAQVLLYQENFSGTGTIAGVYATPGNSWYIEAANPSTLSMSSKGNYARTENTVGNTKSLFITLSTLGYSNATISWNQFRNNFKNSNFPLTARLELQYSINYGATRKTFYTSTNNINGIWNKVNNGTPVELPAEVMGMPEVRIYWAITFTNEKNEYAYYAIDDITILGTPETGLSTFDWSKRPLDENPFVVSGLTAATPYSVDGVDMRWSTSFIGTGVAFETAKVDDKNFKAGTRSLTLVQTGASATAGSIVQLDLSKPVEDLTFTIFDVDFTAGQFMDRLTITGYNGGTKVEMVKKKVRTTSYNVMAASAPYALSGLLNNDNAAAEGDAMITFPQPVTRVVIQYNNDVANPVNNGRQGIGIHNLSWRKEQQIVALPVELLSFKAQNQQSAAVLSWATASERDNHRFEVERSQDGRNFTKIGEVAGSGTSSIKRTYTFTDAKPAVGTNHYRLRQVDFDETATYSKSVAVAFAAPKPGEALAKVYPTIATDKITVAMAPAVQPSVDVVVLDAAGKVIMQFAKITDAELVVPVQTLKTGLYFVTVTNGTTRDTYRFLKQ